MALCHQPVVAIVGHIDHGKTTLLDAIRKSDTALKEAGGITQKLSAYEVTHPTKDGDKKITFIDTPGHEAFMGMRRRSAGAADIAIVIVAADDGVKPQTVEAIKAVTESKTPMIVCFTKTDKDTANLDRAKESVLREGIYLEGLGGDVPWAAVSAKSGDGISELLDLILLVADVESITCDDASPALAVVIESSRDPRSGVSATVIVKAGTFTTGGFAVSGKAFAPLRVIEDFTGAKQQTLSCGRPARITGFSSEPEVGNTVSMVPTKREAEDMVDKAERSGAQTASNATQNESDKPTIRIVVKADSVGGLEALEYELNKVQHEDVDVVIAGRGVGSISEADVKLLIGFSPSALLGFNVKADATAKDLAERQHIALETRAIIYELSEWLKTQVLSHVPDRSGDAVTGSAKILKLFSVAGVKHVLGGRVEEGMLKVGDLVLINRRGIEVGLGKVVNLQLQRSNVDSVPAGSECGMQVDTKADVVAGDTIIAGGPARAALKPHG